jgi:predicted nucleotidyltransferase
MRDRSDLCLEASQRVALDELRQQLVTEFRAEAALLYGSVARGEADEESDMDVLVLTPERLSRRARHRITDAVFELNLRHGTNLSTVVVDRRSWETGLVSASPFRGRVMAEAVPL